jgi:hypothetical protein
MCGLKGLFGGSSSSPEFKTPDPTVQAVNNGDQGTVDSVEKQRKKRGFQSTRTAVDTALGTTNGKNTLG